MHTRPLAPACLIAVLLSLPPLSRADGQDPAGPPKTRLELADSARRTPASSQRPAAPAPTAGVRADEPGIRRILSHDFVRNQTLLGIALYGPSFAMTVAKDPIPATAAYLVMAGGSFFAAAELSRDMNITDGMELLASRAPLRGAAVGAALQYALTGRHDYAAGIFFGSILGTTGALTLGQRLTPGAAMASMFGADATAALAMASMYAFKSDTGSARGRAALGAGAALAGMQLGAMYATYANYTVTAGDVQTLWTSSAIGAAAAGAAVANGHPGTKTTTLTIIGGSLAGLVAGDRFLVRRYDHSTSEGGLVGIAGVAGALMGGGVAVLAGSSGRFNGATAALGALGATGGVVMAERWMRVRPDAARGLGKRVSFAPQSLGLVAARCPGTYSIVSFSF